MSHPALFATGVRATAEKLSHIRTSRERAPVCAGAKTASPLTLSVITPTFLGPLPQAMAVSHRPRPEDADVLGASRHVRRRLARTGGGAAARAQMTALVCPAGQLRLHASRKKAGYSSPAPQKHWPCLFPQHGPGRKHQRKIELEPWQEEIVSKHPGDFARGLFHSDGCRLINRVRRPVKGGDRFYEYPRYLFVNMSADIHRLCGEALDRLGVALAVLQADDDLGGPGGEAVARAGRVRRPQVVDEPGTRGRVQAPR